jgi:hypothetical protein
LWRHCFEEKWLSTNGTIDLRTVKKLEDEPRSGRPSTSRSDENVVKVKTLVRNDGRVTVVQIAAEVGLSVVSVHAILKEDLGLRRVCGKFVSRLLSDDQMECRKTTAGELFEQPTQGPSFLGKVVTGDESWVFEYDPETKMQSSEWHKLVPALQEVPSNKIQHQGHVGDIFR